MYIIDTDFLINFFNGKKENSDIISRIVAEKQEILLTSINHYELLKGCYKSGNFEKNFKFITDFKKTIRIVDFDEESSAIAAKIFNDLEKKGRMIDETDVLIAAICMKNRCTLLTDNKKHYEKINELKIL